MRESDWSPGLCELVEEEEEDRERLLLVERYEVPRFVPSGTEASSQMWLLSI